MKDNASLIVLKEVGTWIYEVWPLRQEERVEHDKDLAKKAFVESLFQLRLVKYFVSATWLLEIDSFSVYFLNYQKWFRFISNVGYIDMLVRSPVFS